MNHETQRLLVAASRGARVQTHYNWDDNWCDTCVLYTLSPELHRIHPEDVYLQYGVISSELQRFASGMFDDVREHLITVAHPAIKNLDLFAENVSMKDAMRSRTFILFLAELAADAGM